MVKLKTTDEIKVMSEAGRRLREVVKEIFPKIKPGVATEYIDQEAERLIRARGDEPSFQKVNNYKWTVCVPVNEQIVHTPPSKRVLKDGDVLTVDIGLYHKGFHTDFARTLMVGESRDGEIAKFLKVGEETLKKAISSASSFKYIGEISKLIEKEIYGNGYFISKELTGHGVGRDLHEEPYVPGFLNRPVEKTYRIRPGLVIAIEIIYSMGTENIVYEEDSDWSIVTADGSISACFEDTIAFTHEKVLKIT